MRHRISSSETAAAMSAVTHSVRYRSGDDRNEGDLRGVVGVVKQADQVGLRVLARRRRAFARAHATHPLRRATGATTGAGQALYGQTTRHTPDTGSGCAYTLSTTR